MATPKFLRISEVEEFTGLKRPTIYAYAAAGLFPRPFKIGSRASGWRLDQLNEWAESRVQASRQ